MNCSACGKRLGKMLVDEGFTKHVVNCTKRKDEKARKAKKIFTIGVAFGRNMSGVAGWGYFSRRKGFK